MKLPTPDYVSMVRNTIIHSTANSLLELINKKLSDGIVMFSYSEILNNENRGISRKCVEKILNPTLKQSGWKLKWKNNQTIKLLEIKVKKPFKWFGLRK